MTKEHSFSIPGHLSLILIGIVASFSVSAAFLPHDSTARVTPSSSSPSSLVAGALSLSTNAITDARTESEMDMPRIHRYESPFLPTSGDDSQRIPSALIILNTPIKSKNSGGILSGVLGALWEASSYRVCADGGANRLYEATVVNPEAGGETVSTTFLPDLITGDLDSLRPEVRRYYETRGVSIIRVEDQNFHDLDKSLMAVEKWIEKVQPMQRSNNDEYRSDDNRGMSRAFIYGGFGGRFDQEMGCMNALCVWGKKDIFQRTTLALYDEETCAFALPESPMKSEIRIRFPGNASDDEKQTNRVGEGPTCGLIPLLGRCEKVKTTGLKWNLEGDTPLEFGGLVSSSNRVINEVATVETSSPMIFTAEMIVKQE